MRYALYFTPPMSEPLARVAANWLGRNVFSGERVEPPAIGHLSSDDIAHHTAAPRRYGFHATIKAPFHLADPAAEPEFLSEIMHFCSGREPFELPLFEISRIGSFFALTLSGPSLPMQSLADDVVTHFEPFRAALSDADIERRMSDGMASKQVEYLNRWGYPYVFEQFRFHMTLTGPVADAEAARVGQALHAFFDPVLSEPVEVASLALFIEPERGAPFLVDSLHPLGRVEKAARRASL